MLNKLTEPVAKGLNKVLLENSFKIKKDGGIPLSGKYSGRAKDRIASIERLNVFVGHYNISVKVQNGLISMTPHNRLGEVVLLAYREKYFGQKSN